METTIVAALGAYGGAFVVGAISSVFPLASIEVFLVALTLASGANPVLVVPLAAAGQLAGKLPIYAASRGVADRTLERLRDRIARWRRAPLLVLTASTVTGLPPFSLMATAAGILGIRVRPFCAIVFVGRAARFAIIIAIASQFR